MTLHVPTFFTLSENPGMGGGGGPVSAPAGESGGFDSSGDGVTSDDPAAYQGQPEASDPTDPDADDPDEDAHVPFRNDPTYKAMRNKLRRTQRRLAETRTFAEQAKSLGDLKDVTYKLRAFERIEREMARNPHLRALVTGQPVPERPQPRAQAPTLDAEFPFDRNDPGGKWLYNFVQQVQQQRQADLRELQELRGFKQEFTGERERVTQQTWTQARDAAAAKLPKTMQKVFKDAMYGAYLVAKMKGVRIHPQKVVDHYLNDPELGLELSNQQKKIASAAAQQRMAEGNRQLPQRSAMVGGSAAPVNGDRSKDNVKSIAAKLLKRRVV